MELLLMGLCVSMFGLAIAAMAFGAATRSERGTQSATTATTVAPSHAVTTAQRFFAGRPESAPQVPIEALLAQIENHVRLEHAAAESFVESPTLALLHSKTISTLVH